MSRINLQPGNWFELFPVNPEKIIKYSTEELKNEIIKQVNNRHEQLEIIKEKPYCISKKDIDNIMFDITDEKIASINKFMKGEKSHPLITFHSTIDLISAENILNNGYILKKKAVHGRAYGNGIYSSPFFEKALAYSHGKNNNMIINLVFLGKFILTNNHNDGDQIDTKIIFGLDQIVSTNPQRVIPIGKLLIK